MAAIPQILYRTGSYCKHLYQQVVGAFRLSGRARRDLWLSTCETSGVQVSNGLQSTPITINDIVCGYDSFRNIALDCLTRQPHQLAKERHSESSYRQREWCVTQL